MVGDKIVAWWMLSRPAFHLLGILPFLLGTLFAWKWENTLNIEVLFWGSLAVLLIMLATYHAGEYYDFAGDLLSRRIQPSRFAGGSGVLPSGTLPRSVALSTSWVSLCAAAFIGLYLQWGLDTGPYTLLLGCLGALMGFFYSSPPVRLIDRGVGELCIAFCYGWLPVASAFYLQTSHIHPLIHWITPVIGLSVFNVILLNEFPDFQADRRVGKRNILQRLGKRAGAVLFACNSALQAMAVLLSVWAGVPTVVFYVYFPFMILSGVTAVAVVTGRHDHPATLEKLCALNMLMALGTVLSYGVAFFVV